MPVANSNRPPPTSSSSDSRSSAWPADRSGGSANSFGATDHSFASSTGTSTTPSVTCTPWVRR
jgi:hypothetical protein